MKNKKGRGCLAKFISIVLLLAICLSGFWWFENYTFRVNKVSVENNKVKKEIKILHMSDLHSQLYGKNNESLIRKIDQLNPDLIFATGDMATADDKEGQDQAAALLGHYSSDIPVYFVPGEHDRSTDFSNRLRQLGVHVLRYETEEITLKGTNIVLYGIDNASFTPSFDLNNSFATPDKTKLNLLLAHIPNLDGYDSFPVDYVFSGDTHGGVMQLPFVGPLYANSHWFPKFTTKEPIVDKGVFEQEGIYFFVSGGLGNYPVPARFFNRPEMSLITISPPKADK